MKGKKRNPRKAMLQSFARRCLSVSPKDLGAENTQMKRDLKGYVRRHKIRIPANVKLVGARFGKGRDDVLEAGENCGWTFIGWSWDDQQICQQWQYECDGKMVAYFEACEEIKPNDPLLEYLTS